MYVKGLHISDYLHEKEYHKLELSRLETEIRRLKEIIRGLEKQITDEDCMIDFEALKAENRELRDKVRNLERRYPKGEKIWLGKDQAADLLQS